MSCLRPIDIRAGKFHSVTNFYTNRRYIGADRSMSDIFTVPCGHCIPCRVKRTQDWSIRLMYELNYHQKAIFITLTYDNDNIIKTVQPSGGFSVVKKHFQDFIKRVRRTCEYYGVCSARSIKYFACGEYGGQFGRPHYHAILYGLGVSDDRNPLLGCPFSEGHIIERCWPFGGCFIGFVEPASCAYVAGYVQKKVYGKEAPEYYGDLTPPFLLMSKHLGLQFFKDNLDYFRRGLISWHGKDINLPRYYFDRIRNDNEFKQNYQKLLKKGFDTDRNRVYKKVKQSLIDDELPLYLMEDDDVFVGIQNRFQREATSLLEKQTLAREKRLKYKNDVLRSKL